MNIIALSFALHSKLSFVFYKLNFTIISQEKEN